MTDRAAPLAHRGMRPIAELAADRPHGDRLRYRAGCRCAECRRANSSYENERSKARKAGDWNGFVDASKARAHMEALAEAGVGRRQIADASGVAQSILLEVRSGKRAKIRARTERSVLAVTAAAIADRALVDAAPTWKLLDDLLASGYSKAQLARELGFERAALQIGRKQCTARNAYDVQRLHERLRRVPAQATVRLLWELRHEGYRPQQIERMAGELARRLGRPAPNLTVYGMGGKDGLVDAAAADLVARLHAEVTQVPEEASAS